MSDMLRNVLVSTMVICMAVFAFLAGYLSNDYIDERDARAALAEDQFVVFWEAWDKVNENFLGDLPASEQITYSAIRGSLQSLDDPYTVFLEPVVREEERQTLRGNFGGIGVSLSRDENGNLLLEPTPENPAARAGILSGDILIAIDGEPVSAELTVHQVADLLRGEKGTDVTLTIVHQGQTSAEEISVTRDDILIPSVISRLLREDRTIGYVKLTRFSAESGGEIENAILSLREQGAKSFILDMRDNGGGLLSAAIDVSGQFLDSAVVYHQNTRGEGESTESTGNNPVLPDAPLALLINRGTASSSEIVAGAIQDHERAPLIGEKTFGKGSVQLVYDLSDGSSVHVTWARWLTPNRREIDQNGLEPNLPVSVTQEARDDGRDEILERAIIYLQTGS